MLLPLILCALAAEPFKIPESVPQPRVVDERLKLECLVAEPDLVTPTGIAVDDRGRVLVIECHTHFPPKDYAGPKHDRIRMFEDTDGDGKLDKVSTFYEGTRATMNLAIYRDGSVFVATRSEVFRLFDADGDGVAEKRQPIARLETAGDYPHNGLSGFAFDFDGNVYFGMGENLGAAYKLIGKDAAKPLEGGGEGGNIFCCDADGGNLRRVATGFWNPFHLTFDAFGQLFAVDNDPDSRPPCRLLHIVEGGDYGFKFRHGRKGVHPFTAWNGELPGTLPMVCGTGEAPCAVLAYESDNLPEDYRSDLLVTSWGDHRIERYKLEQRGASFVSTMKPVVIGGDQFRPVGLALAPDGSLYFSDWVDKSYPVHGKGRIWRLSNKTVKKPERPTEPWRMMFSDHRPLRERGAEEILKARVPRRDEPRVALDVSEEIKRHQGQAALKPPSTRSQYLRMALRRLPLPSLHRDLLMAEGDSRVWAAIALDSDDVLAFAPGVHQQGGNTVLDRTDPLWVATALRQGHGRGQWGITEQMLADPFMLQAAVQSWRRDFKDFGVRAVVGSDRNGRLATALNAPERKLSDLLNDPDPRVNYVAVKRIAEHKLRDYRHVLDNTFAQRRTTRELYAAYLAAVEMLEGGKSDAFDRLADDMLYQRLTAKETAPEMRAFLLRMISPGYEKLPTKTLVDFVGEADPQLRLEAIRTLRERIGPERDAALVKVAGDEQVPVGIRAEAVMGLTSDDKGQRELLERLADKAPTAVAIEAMRNLTGLDPKAMPLWLKRQDDPRDRDALVTELWQRAAGKYQDPRWDEKLQADLLGTVGDAAAGERVFFHSKVAICSRCHQHSGRGGQVGPDLTNIAGAMSRERILESLVAPNREIAPQYTSWIVSLNDGRTFIGLLQSEELNGDQNYLDANGRRYRVKPEEIDSRKPSQNSLMPEGLRGQMTKEELRDLLAFLSGEKK